MDVNSAGRWQERVDGAVHPAGISPLVGWLLVGIVGVAVVASALGSEGFVWDDDYAHLLYSLETVQGDWRAVLHAWGRPLMTIVYIPAALTGDTAVRLTSLGLLTLAAACLGAVGRSGSLPRWLPALLLVVQPLTALLGSGAMTQLLFSAVWALGFAARARGRHAIAAVAVSLLPLARLEGVVVVAIWAAIMLVERRWRAAVLCGTGLLLWAAVAGVTFGDALWLLKANPYGYSRTTYPAAGWQYAFLVLPVALGPIVAGLVLTGLLRWRELDLTWTWPAAGLFTFYAVTWVAPVNSYPTPLYLASLAAPAALVASVGLPVRGVGATLSLGVGSVALGFAALLTTSPLVAGVFGLTALLRLRLDAVTPRLAMAVTAVVTALAALLLLAVHRPIPRSPAVTNILKSSDRLGARASAVTISTHPAFDWYVGTRTTFTWTRPESAPRGALMIWDGKYGASRWSVDELTHDGWEIVWSEGAGHGEIAVFRRQ